MGIEIRQMRESDMESIMELLAQWNMQPRLNDPSAERSGVDVENTVVAMRDERLVGVASFIVHTDDLAETASLAVAPSDRGNGIGYQLQQARLSKMRRRGIRRVRTETDRPETIQWYLSKFGYRIVGTNPKKHAFSLPDVQHWTVLELDLGEVAKTRGDST